MTTDIPDMIDLTAPGVVQIEVREDGKVVWVNINGICRLRMCRIDTLIVDCKPSKHKFVFDHTGKYEED